MRPRSASKDSAALDLYALDKIEVLSKPTHAGPWNGKTDSMSLRTPLSKLAWSTAVWTFA